MSGSVEAWKAAIETPFFEGDGPLLAAGDALAAELDAERAEHRRTAERWDEERRKWYAERERLVAQLAAVDQEPKEAERVYKQVWRARRRG
jgi:hypothetical protein